ncbi:uncharacterized protein LOC136088070 [Hydra vulgaris]|uniref:Uncharacterized protein LOC136088070 n=1 Tax=Hydra vulgaris TaxID=6087 RepID=A0ABM4D0N6_HYDVU
MFFEEQKRNQKDNDTKSNLKHLFTRPNPNWTPPTDKNEKLKRFFTIIDKETNKILATQKIDNDYNMTKAEYNAMDDLSKDNNIVIKRTDKGGGTCIIDYIEYEKKVLLMLQDKNTYDELKENPTNSIALEVTREINHMKNILIITEKLENFMRPVADVRTPLFYGLPKIHKEGVPLRPIVAGCEGPTDNILEYVVKYLQPMAESLSAYFKDTTQLLKILSNYPVPSNNYLLITADVVSLYTNIPHEDGINAVEEFIRNRWQLLKHPENLPPIIPTTHFSRLLRLFLTNSTFMFGSRNFRQKFGTSMGTRMAPPYANIFMGVLDENICPNLEKILLYIKDLLMTYL